MKAWQPLAFEVEKGATFYLYSELVSASVKSDL
jgi:hypothetical protein